MVQNSLVPKHRKISEEELQELLQRHSLSDKSKLPKIREKDAALAGLEIQAGDVVEITRKSFAGETLYYRLVV
ncbi:DNA-directed RNA polymerase subunit H [Candidatus Woesearchaeota archaeon]|nr:DNA-directed RNA polymerase subunit H [Nanoarchaeota archaeon]MCB9370082.1 DNA-directed RNA polymerase subunit H [Candidatus Woesearchaeota archaeon]USN44613.1 MAG: DNA-directed RNA polymerase subunit H [Candidatus Woesearchaeota archaeon]